MRLKSLEFFMLAHLRRVLPALAIVAGVALPFVVSSCDKVPLTAPTGTVINLFAAANSVSLNSSVDVIATAIENGRDTGTSTGTTSSTAGAGTPVQNGTLISFTTTVGSIQPSEARTHNGQVTVKLVTGSQSGTATITAYSGGASKQITIKIGTAAASHVQVTASPQSLGSGGGTSAISALVTDDGGSPIGGIPVSFTTDQGTLNPSTATTDTNGVATTQLTTAQTATVSVSAGSVTAQTVKVAVGVKALASFTASPTAASAGTPITFTVTPGTGANVQNVRVDFGDGSSQSLGAIAGATTTSHAYNSPGSYTATATATDATGVSSLTANVIVGSAPIILNASPSSTTAGSPITFTVIGLGTSAQVDHYEWNFDDGASATTSGPQLSHVFNSRGTHYASVKVIAVGGGSLGSAQAAVTIQ
jgi:hypothetical protein